MPMRKGALLHQYPNVTREELADLLDWCLIGGNHLASGLGHTMTGDWSDLTREQVSHKFEREKSISYQTYEMWIAWRCAMDAAEALRATGEADHQLMPPR